MKKFLVVGLIIGVLVMLGIIGYQWFSGNSTEREVTIEKDEATSLAVNVQFDAGELVIQGGSTNWLDAIFDTKDEKFLPNVTYTNKKDTGVLTVKPKSNIFRFNKGKQKNYWDIQLNNDIPIDLDVDMGVSKATLNLNGIQLNNLTIDSGVSDSTIDLSGERQNDLQGDIDVGVGKMTLLLPKQTGVKLIVDKGLGTLELKDFIAQSRNVYVNEAYTDKGTTIEIDVDLGVGTLKVDLVE
ncbi:toast rack family protein [Sporosarcina sp. GW1-11]|uniref:toast rack family protein n=1 Tax=Sporosarcina sp. GW1-11 TaxID=2899126 RepID=UPI00294F147A|nr:toast rack family protein [Sporosarcina sp. GW1-11]MDV6377850.1 toast rack family protein [Sporosarcina sp. GW1-11]